MSLPYNVTGSGLLLAVGSAVCLSKLYDALSWLWLYTRSSSIDRYRHTSPDGQPPWALVTGSTGGIGTQLCHQLAARGFNVVLHGRSADKLRRLEAEMAAAHPGRSFRTLVADAAQAFAPGAGLASADWAARLDDIHLTVLINCAGGSVDRTFGPLEALGPARWLADASVNAMFPTLLIGQLIPRLERSAPSLVVNVGSLADLGVALVGSYPASKTYLMKLTETLGREMRLKGRDVEVLGVRVANVWGTQQTVSKATSPTLLAPDAPTMARAILDKVGCGRHVVVAYWTHALQTAPVGLLPGFIREKVLIDAAKDWGKTE